LAKNEKDNSKATIEGTTTEAKVEASKGTSSNKSSNRNKGNRQRGGSRNNNAKGNNSALVNRWMAVGQLAIDATNISTFNSAGAKNPPIIGTAAAPAYTPAGVMRLDYVPYFGVVDSTIDPINVSAKNMYDIVNAKNSRNPSYDPSDLMIYCISVANAWGIWSFVRRLIGMYCTFSPINRYWWQPVLHTMGIDPISVSNDITAWRNVANRMALNLNRLAVPANIPYFGHVIDMCSKVYKDSDTDKASYYYYHPVAFMRYEYGSDKIGRLVNMQAPWSPDDPKFGKVKPEDVEWYFNYMCQNLFNDTDINTIASDIIKAYGIENCFRCDMLGLDYQVLPEYDSTMNLITHNARVCPMLKASDVENEYALVQNVKINGLRSDFEVEWFDDEPCYMQFRSDVIEGHEIPLDFPFDGPENAAIMLATRFTLYATTKVASPEDKIVIMGCTDAVINLAMFTFEEDADLNWTLQTYDKMSVISLASTTAPDIRDFIKKFDVAAKFHDAPLQYAVFGNSNKYDNPLKVAFTSDVTNFTTVSPKVLKNIHDAATFSIFFPAAMKGKSRDEG
jgi:hypothetical protein